MSKAPKQKKSQHHHYQPYQLLPTNVSDVSQATSEFPIPDLVGNAVTMDPVLTNVNRNLWDDWNESDSMKLDMFHLPYENANGNTTEAPPASSTTSTNRQLMDILQTTEAPAANGSLLVPELKRSLSDELASMLEDPSTDFLFDGRQQPQKPTPSAHENGNSIHQQLLTQLQQQQQQQQQQQPAPVPSSQQTNGWMNTSLPSQSTVSSTSNSIPPPASMNPLSYPQPKPVTPSAYQQPESSTHTNDAAPSSSATTPTGLFGNQGMMMPGFMMYPMPMMGNYAPNGMNMMPMGAMQPMQMPMNVMNQLPMGSFPMPTMQMPMPMGLNMNMSMNMGMQLPLAMQIPLAPAVPVAPKQPVRAIQPKDTRPPGSFVNIARKPEEPEVSSMLKALMEEEAKKKEKKLERNRDSARESRRKQQTYVETLENGIKRLQLNRDVVHAYQWGRSDVSNRLQVVTGDSESLTQLQNPESFEALMRVHRHRRPLTLTTDDRLKAVHQRFRQVGRLLHLLRRRILELYALRATRSSELRDLLGLSADQQQRLGAYVDQAFASEVLELVALFKVFHALRNEALRLVPMAPSLETVVRETLAIDQLHKLFQWTEAHRTAVETLEMG